MTIRGISQRLDEKRLESPIIAAWIVMLVVARWQVLSLYLVPVLALLTFFLLPRFPLIVSALFLSAYLDSSSASRLSELISMLLIVLIWLVAGAVLLVRSRYPIVQLQGGQNNPGLPSLSASVRHDLRTPVNLIEGFCDILLGPSTEFRSPLSPANREHIEAIYRNSKQLQELIDNLFAGPEPNQVSTVPGRTNLEPSTNKTRKSLILLDKDEMASVSFNQFATRYSIVNVPDLEALGKLQSGISAVLVNSPDSSQVPLIAELLGRQIPIMIFDLGRSPRHIGLHSAQEYLMKPIQFEALSSALERIGQPLQNVLIIDDNVDSASMIAHMVQSLPEHPQVWNAYSGREALALFREGVTPSVIILDFVLPDMNGLTLIEYLHLETNLMDIPVLLISAHRPQDIVRTPGVTKLTLYRMAGISPESLVKAVESLVSEL